MYTEYLREFITFARRLNFTAAAAELGLSQPSLSRHVADLEKHYGTALVERGETLSLTYAGEVLLDGASALLEREDALEAQMAQAKNVHISELRIQDWRYSHRAMGVVRRAAADLSRSTPWFRTRFVPLGPGDDVRKDVREGTLDIGVLAHTAEGEATFEEDELSTLPLKSAQSHLCFFVGPQSPLAQKETASIDDLRGQTIIVPLISECSNIRGDIAALCESRGFTPTFGSTTCSNIDDLFCMDLKAGLLIGISEYFDRGFESCGAHMVRCSDDVNVTSYLLYSSSNDNPMLAQFIEAVLAADK